MHELDCSTSLLIIYVFVRYPDTLNLTPKFWNVNYSAAWTGGLMQSTLIQKTLFIFTLVLSISSTTSVRLAHALGDLTPAMIAETEIRIEALYGVKYPFLMSTLNNVPIYKADSAFLGKWGSSMGIYLRKTLYMHESMFDANGVIVSSPTAFGVLLHEAWHAYYEQVLSLNSRGEIERIWDAYYGSAGKNWDDSVWIGDEAVGNYLQNITFIYSHSATRVKDGKVLNASFKKLYQEGYVGKDIYGYDDVGDMSPLPISSKEVQFILKITGDAFPDPTLLEDTLKKRFFPGP